MDVETKFLITLQASFEKPIDGIKIMEKMATLSISVPESFTEQQFERLFNDLSYIVSQTFIKNSDVSKLNLALGLTETD